MTPEKQTGNTTIAPETIEKVIYGVGYTKGVLDTVKGICKGVLVAVGTKVVLKFALRLYQNRHKLNNVATYTEAAA